jgi:hypothetical protein
VSDTEEVSIPAPVSVYVATNEKSQIGNNAPEFIDCERITGGTTSGIANQIQEKYGTPLADRVVKAPHARRLLSISSLRA